MGQALPLNLVPGFRSSRLVGLNDQKSLKLEGKLVGLRHEGLGVGLAEE